MMLVGCKKKHRNPQSCLFQILLARSGITQSITGKVDQLSKNCVVVTVRVCFSVLNLEKCRAQSAWDVASCS